MPRGCQMGVRLAAGDVFNFLGFRDNDLTTLSAFCRDSYSQELKEQQMSTTGAFVVSHYVLQLRPASSKCFLLCNTCRVHASSSSNAITQRAVKTIKNHAKLTA